jgi:hypothetical protein
LLPASCLLIACCFLPCFGILLSITFIQHFCNTYIVY